MKLDIMRLDLVFFSNISWTFALQINPSLSDYMTFLQSLVNERNI